MSVTSQRYHLPSAPWPRSAHVRLAGAPMPLAGALRVWTCGITPYDVTHLGHAATFIWTDLLVSLAHKLGIKTISTRNVTDIDDVLTAAAAKHGERPEEFAVTQEFMFDQDMRALNIARPDLNPRARAHLPQIIEFIDALIELGAAYEAQGTVYFQAPAAMRRPDSAAADFAEFGDNAVSAGRRGEWDVAIWKSSGEGDPAWPSPWGWGRPGWHVECAAMARAVLGSSIDVLAGGADLTFPHHAYQQAMASALSGCTFASRSMHVGTVWTGGAKMAKSTGNLVLVKDLVAQSSGETVRLLLLNRVWNLQWDYTPDALQDAAVSFEALHQAAGRAGVDGVDEVMGALANDLNVPAALEIALARGGVAARTLADVLKV